MSEPIAARPNSNPFTGVTPPHADPAEAVRQAGETAEAFARGAEQNIHAATGVPLPWMGFADRFGREWTDLTVEAWRRNGSLIARLSKAQTVQELVTAQVEVATEAWSDLLSRSTRLMDAALQQAERQTPRT